MAFSVSLSFSKVARIKQKFSIPYKQLVKSRKQDILSSKQSIRYPRNGNRKNSQRDSFGADINLNHSPREMVGYVYESTKLSTFRLSQIDSIDSSKTLFEGIYHMLSFTFYLCYDIAQSNNAWNIGNIKLQSCNICIYIFCLLQIESKSTFSICDEYEKKITQTFLNKTRCIARESLPLLHRNEFRSIH